MRKILVGLAGLASVLAFSACGTVQQKQPVQNSSKSYLLTVPINKTDQSDEITQKYGGEIIAWYPKSSFAVIKISQLGVQKLKSKGVSLQNTTLEPNGKIQIAESPLGFAWAGGWSAWAGGWSAWAGGWSAWAGGVITQLPAGIRPTPVNGMAWRQIKLREAYSVSRNLGDGIKVAVIDTGIDTTHPAFAGRLAPSSEWYDYVDNNALPDEVSGGKAYGHGTGVAGIVLQVAPRAKILPIRVLDTHGKGDVDNIIKAIAWATSKQAHVINLSLGTKEDVAALRSVIEAANQAGIMVFSSAGNEGAAGKMTYPAKLALQTATKRIFSIGSIGANDDISSFTSEAGLISAAAPGESIVTAYPGNSITKATGTSFAVPIYSGAAALALSNLATADRPRVASILYASLNNTPSVGNTGRMLQKVVNAERLIQSLPGFRPLAYRIVNLGHKLCIDAPSTTKLDFSPEANCTTQWRVEFVKQISYDTPLYYTKTEEKNSRYIGSFYRIVNASTGKVLEVSNGSFIAAPVQQADYTGKDNQLWAVQSSDGTFPVNETVELAAKHSGLCLSINLPKAGPQPKAEILQSVCNSASNQKWGLRMTN
jgi:thermitase